MVVNLPISNTMCVSVCATHALGYVCKFQKHTQTQTITYVYPKLCCVCVVCNIILITLCLVCSPFVHNIIG